MSTVESTNNIIIIKLKSLFGMVSLISRHSVQISPYIISQINLLDETYSLGSTTILSDYYIFLQKYKSIKTSDEKKVLDVEKVEHYKKYTEFLCKESIISKLDFIFAKLMTFIKKHNIKVISNYPTQNDFYENHEYYELGDYWFIFENMALNKTITPVEYNSCNCSNTLTNIQNSEFVCESCGITQTIQGTEVEEEPEVKQKYCNYDPSKHCKIWVERIQARENADIPQEVITTIKECIRRDKIKDLRMINCYTIRRYLQQTHHSKYNEHIPLIRKIITGISPMQLTEREVQLINIYFDKVIRIFDEIKPATKTNCPYHPFFIYKIIEQIIKNPKERCRKEDILSTIYLQSRDTLVQNDLIWKSICERISDFTYMPTDREINND